MALTMFFFFFFIFFIIIIIFFLEYREYSVVVARRTSLLFTCIRRDRAPLGRLAV